MMNASCNLELQEISNIAVLYYNIILDLIYFTGKEVLIRFKMRQYVSLLLGGCSFIPQETLNSQLLKFNLRLRTFS